MYAYIYLYGCSLPIKHSYQQYVSKEIQSNTKFAIF